MTKLYTLLCLLFIISVHILPFVKFRLPVSVRWQSSLSSDRSKRCVWLLVVLLSGGTGIFRSLVMSFAQNGLKMCSSIQCSAGYVIACDCNGMAVGHECPTREKASAVTTNEHIHRTLLISTVTWTHNYV